MGQGTLPRDGSGGSKKRWFDLIVMCFMKISISIQQENNNKPNCSFGSSSENSQTSSLSPTRTLQTKSNQTRKGHVLTFKIIIFDANTEHGVQSIVKEINT